MPNFGEIGGGRWSPPPKTHKNGKPKSNGALIFQDNHVAPNTASSLIWKDVVETESSNVKIFEGQFDKYCKEKAKPPERRRIRKVGSNPMYLSNLASGPITLKPKTIEETMYLPRGVKYVTPPSRFKSNYNQGCYAPYQIAKEVPTQHMVHTLEAKPNIKPGHGTAFSIVGASSLTPTRFLKGKATKAWVGYVGTSGKNNQFRNLTTSAQEANKGVEKSLPPKSFKERASAAVRATTKGQTQGAQNGSGAKAAGPDRQNVRSATPTCGVQRHAAASIPRASTSMGSRRPQRQPQLSRPATRASTAEQGVRARVAGNGTGSRPSSRAQPRASSGHGMRSSREETLTEREAQLEQREQAMAEKQVRLESQERVSKQHRLEELKAQIAKDNQYLFNNPSDKYYKELAKKNTWELRRLYEEGIASPATGSLSQVLSQPLDQRLWTHVPRFDE